VIRTLIVDDEPIARTVLREELDEFPDVVVVGEAENGQDALERIRELSPDLVFLDLEMPVMGGFEVIRNLTGGALPVIIIVTAYNQHAVEAFEAGRSSLSPSSNPGFRKRWNGPGSCVATSGSSPKPPRSSPKPCRLQMPRACVK
jgi:CheY-like chemotaxis protein